MAVQNKGESKIYWILETKGREYPELESKNKAIERWCKAVTKQTGDEWKYLMVKQTYFKSIKNNVETFDVILPSRTSGLLTTL